MALDRFFRLHNTRTASEETRSESDKTPVKVFMKSTPTVAVWDGVPDAPGAHTEESEDEEDEEEEEDEDWGGMDVAEDDGTEGSDSADEEEPPAARRKRA